jgi:hypothetical protein
VKFRRKNIFTVLLTAMLFAAQSGSLFACASCYGDPSSPMSSGLTWAISVLVGVVACVLAGVVTFFVRTIRNSSAMDEPSTPVVPPTKPI